MKASIALICLFVAVTTSSKIEAGVFQTKESHPFQAKLVCERAPGGLLVGVMYDLSNGSRNEIARFSRGHVGACELAVRSSRDGRVCVGKNFGYEVVKISDRSTLRSFGTDLKSCLDYSRGSTEAGVTPGYLEFMSKEELAHYRSILPRVASPRINQLIHDKRTILFDDSSMVFTYQDSFGNPKGLRANRVGYDVGSNSSVPDIKLLTNYFRAGQFRFPFSIAAGATFDEPVHVFNFWRPPVVLGQTLPVKYWKNNSHWNWVFPVGTLIGEVLTIQAPDDGTWFVFEVRVRERTRRGWKTSLFRPFATPSSLASAIKAKRPNWRQTDLVKLVSHLESGSLRSHSLPTASYKAIVPEFKGAMDYLPETSDYRLIKELLAETEFKDVMGTTWKAQGSLKSYAASTKAAFHIVPKDYIGGMLSNTEESCNRCHERTSQPLNNLDGRVILYGEMWGEDRVFTWHPFEIGIDSFTVSDGNRRPNQRMVDAGLIESGQPRLGSIHYKEQARPYKAVYE